MRKMKKKRSINVRKIAHCGCACASFARKAKRVKPEQCPEKGKQLPMPLKESELLRAESKIMEAICDRDNLNKAYKNVLKNKGAAGIDGMTVDKLLPYLKEHGQKVRRKLLDGTYEWQPVRQVEIPKAGGKGTRKLGVATVIDRFVSQAILQVLQKHFDPKFSDHSYGFRPNKSAHQAIAQAQEYIAKGYTTVVDIDLKNFFDNVNHDKLMSELAKTIKDKRLLKLIRQLLRVGILVNGNRKLSDQGTAQGNPLSPLLSNVILDLLDKELEKRGHKFCRFADDCNVYVRSERAGRRVMRSLKIFIEKKLKLQVNEDKSAVGSVYRRSFLGFSFSNYKTLKRRLPPKTVKRFKERVRQLTSKGKGESMQDVMKKLNKYCKGWLAYFGFSQTSTQLRDLGSWTRRRLRFAFWKQWKTGKNRFKQLRMRGVGTELAENTAGARKRPWRISASPALSIALPNSYFYGQGMPEFICATR